MQRNKLSLLIIALVTATAASADITVQIQNTAPLDTKDNLLYFLHDPTASQQNPPTPWAAGQSNTLTIPDQSNDDVMLLGPAPGYYEICRTGNFQDGRPSLSLQDGDVIMPGKPWYQGSGPEPSCIVAKNTPMTAQSACSSSLSGLCTSPHNIIAPESGQPGQYSIVNNFYHGSSGNPESNDYIAEQVSINNQQITLSATPAASGNTNCPDAPGGSCKFDSGAIITKPINGNNGWTTADVGSHGYLEIEASMPVSDAFVNNKKIGIWPALWLLPVTDEDQNQANFADSTWPINGEIDIAELHGQIGNVAQATIHYGNISQQSDYNDETYPQNPSALKIATGDFSTPHYYGVEWNYSDPNKPYLKFYYDGHLVNTYDLNKTSKASNQNIWDSNYAKTFTGKGYYLIANIATGGGFGATSSATTGGSMVIDSIKAYALPGNKKSSS